MLQMSTFCHLINEFLFIFSSERHEKDIVSNKRNRRKRKSHIMILFYTFSIHLVDIATCRLINKKKVGKELKNCLWKKKSRSLLTFFSYVYDSSSSVTIFQEKKSRGMGNSQNSTCQFFIKKCPFPVLKRLSDQDIYECISRERGTSMLITPPYKTVVIASDDGEIFIFLYSMVCHLQCDDDEVREAGTYTTQVNLYIYNSNAFRWKR